MREQMLGGRWCAVCGRARADELHHVVRKSQQGDDYIVNLLELCRACHALVEARDSYALARGRAVIYQRPATRGYVLERKGQGWLDRSYPAWQGDAE